MPEADCLQRNLHALARRNPRLGARISDTKPDPAIKFITSKSSHIVPVQSEGGRIVAFHSRFDPIREGERSLSRNPAFVVVMGLAGGYHLQPLLNRSDVSGVLVIEKNIGMVRAVFESIDLANLLSDPRINIIVDASMPDIVQSMLDLYLPALAGGVSTISLQSRVNLELDYFKNALEAVKTAIDRIADDLATQTRFGLKWFHNTLANMPIAEKTGQTIGPIRNAIVTGAGPSLEDQLPRLKESRGEACLIATDTSWPSLKAYNILPDIVLSIDCQQVSYHHFLSSLPPHTVLALDLASPPVLARLTDRLVFLASGHPFSRFLCQTWRPFLSIDTSGGNVSQAALSLAVQMGAQKIQLLGVDFSYPEGKAYARESYLYPYFRSRENRVLPLENSLFSFLMRGTHIIRKRRGDSICYTTNSMLGYKRRMERAIAQSGVHVTTPPGKGLPLEIGNAEPAESTPEAIQFPDSMNRQTESWRDYATALIQQLKSLPAPTSPASLYWHSLTSEEKRLWYIQLPAFAAMKAVYRQENLGGAELLRYTADWTLSRLEKSIQSR